jgi:hypothetical protein
MDALRKNKNGRRKFPQPPHTIPLRAKYPYANKLRIHSCKKGMANQRQDRRLSVCSPKNQQEMYILSPLS